MARTKKGEKAALELTPEEKLQNALVPGEERPYEIPENWVWTYLSFLINISTGKKDANYGRDNGKYFFFTCANEPIRCEGYSFEGESLLLPGNGANVGKVYYYNGQFEAYQRTYVLQSITNSLSLKYIYFQLLGFWERYNRDKQYGSATNYIKLGNFINYPIPLPPLAEQTRIVSLIETLFSQLDEARAKAQAVVDGFEDRKAAILHRAFTGELTAKWREEKGVDRESWEDKALGSCLYPMQTRNPSGNLFRYIDIDSIDNEKQEVREPKVIKSSEAPSRAKRAVVADDIVFSMVRPYLRNIAMVREEYSDCIASTGFYVCRCKSVILPRFLYEYLRSKDAIDYLMQFMKGDNSPSIRKDDLLEMRMSLPSTAEQLEICNVLRSVLQNEREVKETAEQVISQIDVIKKSILARAFRGELDTNDPTDESAMELLKRILE